MESQNMIELLDTEIDQVAGGNKPQYDAGVALGHAIKDFFAELGNAINEAGAAMGSVSGGTASTGVVY